MEYTSQKEGNAVTLVGAEAEHVVGNVRAGSHVVLNVPTPQALYNTINTGYAYARREFHQLFLKEQPSRAKLYYMMKEQHFNSIISSRSFSLFSE